MAFFSEDFFSARRNEFLQRISRFQYQIDGGDWQDGTINSKELSGTDVVVFASVPSTGEADTITGVRIYDTTGIIAGQQSINLNRSGQSEALLRFSFTLSESE